MEEIKKKIVEFLLQTPKALAVAVFSYLSGQVWLYVIFTYLRPNMKGKSILDNLGGKIGLGLLWHVVVLIPLYLAKHGWRDFDERLILALVVPLIVFALFGQMVIFVLLTLLKK